jgi:PEP-CTERM motif
MKKIRFSSLFAWTRNFIKIFAICGAASLFSSISLQAATVTWTGGGADNNWLNAANWSSNPNLPVTGTGTSGDQLQLDTTANYAIYAAAEGALTYQSIRVGVTANGRLDVTGGTLTADGSTQGRVGVGFAGTENIAGGTLKIGGDEQIGLNNGGVGIVNVSSGILDVTRGSTQDGVANVSLGLGAGGTATGTLNLSGGNIYTRFGVEVGQSSLAGSGTFNVMGSGIANIGTDNGVNLTSAGFWLQKGNGTLAATVDSTGFTLGQINILNGTATPLYVSFETGSTLSLGFSGAAPTSTMSWTLMTFSDTDSLTNNLALAAGDAAAGWSFGIVDNSGTDDLQITYTVPEPSPMALMGLGVVAFGLVVRRRQS